jgi:XrtJ-associated TM-motif-TM protein
MQAFGHVGLRNGTNFGTASGIKFEDTMILRKISLAFGLALVITMALPLRAQTGCDDSPEDPTIILALVGGAGAIAARLGLSRRRKQ